MGRAGWLLCRHPQAPAAGLRRGDTLGAPTAPRLGQSFQEPLLQPRPVSIFGPDVELPALSKAYEEPRCSQVTLLSTLPALWPPWQVRPLPQSRPA